MQNSICFIINSLKAAGAEKYVLDLASSCAKEGVATHVVSLGPVDEDFLKKYDLTNVNIIQYASGKMISLNALRTIYRLYQLMRQKRFMLVHLNMRTPDLVGGIAARFSHSPFISTQHDTQPWRYSKRINDISKKYIHRYIMKFASAIIAPTESVRQYLHETERIPLSKIRVIYHGVDLARFNTKFKKLGKTIYVGSLGRFRPEKGQKYIIEALPKILRRLSPKRIEMQFAGDGPSLDDVRGQAETLGVRKHVKFLGSIYDVPKFLEGINILIHAAVSGEAFCYAALEGLAAGKAVVVTNTDGIPEYVKNNYNGILIPIESPNSIADAIVKLATDPAMYLRICKSAAVSCRPFFSKKRMINRTLELYENVTSHG